MAPTPDPVSILQRLAALSGAGRAVPADLAAAAVSWLADAAGPILAGEAIDAALGLRPPPGARSPATSYRQGQRDAALTRLFCLATGSQSKRGDVVLQWLDAYRDGYPVPAGAVEHLEQVRDAGLRVPGDGGSVARIARARAGVAPAVTVASECGRVAPKARPSPPIE